VQIYEYSGEGLEQIARESFMPVVARTCPDFRGRMELQEMGGAMTVSRAYWGGPYRILRTDRMAATTSAEDLVTFCVHVAGRSQVRQHDRWAELAAGVGVLYEARSAWELLSCVENRSLTMHFSRELLPLRTVEITEGCARGMDPAAPAMRMVSGYLDRLFDVVDELTAQQRVDAGRAAIDLIAMALRDITPAVAGADGSREVLLEMMRVHVREHLSDPRLRVEELARRHHVSVRYVYTLFERIGTTPGAYLREQRLLAARAMLSDPRYARLGMLNIAAAVGFADLSTFERAFRRHYGMTPGGWRREHLSPGDQDTENAVRPSRNRRAQPRGRCDQLCSTLPRRREPQQ
jgi:AraC-like DNA-binding protein